MRDLDSLRSLVDPTVAFLPLHTYFRELMDDQSMDTNTPASTPPHLITLSIPSIGSVHFSSIHFFVVLKLLMLSSAHSSFLSVSCRVCTSNSVVRSHFLVL
jgi:hypothetical protein